MKAGTEGNRSYYIEDTRGHRFRRNRVHIRPDKTQEQDSSDVDDDDDTILLSEAEEDTPSIPRRDTGLGFLPPTHTRSGRVVKPVDRLCM